MAPTGTLRGTPVAGADAGRPAAVEDAELGVQSELFAHEAGPASEPPRTRSRLPLVALAVLLGVGAVAVLAYAQSPRSTPRERPRSARPAPPVRSLAVVSATGSATSEPSATALPTLARTVAPPVRRPPPAKRDAGARPAPSASTPHEPPLFSLPSALPPIPSAIPTDLTLPGFGP